MEDPSSRRLVILGKTGTGKSSLANTIFGSRDLFKVSHKSISETKACVSISKQMHGRNIQLIDTPGLFDTDPKSTKESPELLKCVTECAPGPHAFLLVLKVERYTRQEEAMINVILKYFSEDALRYTTVVFTHGDQLQEGVDIQDWAMENASLKTLIQKCGGRCHVFDNKHWNDGQDPVRNNQRQVQELLNTIEQTVQTNGGGCYTNDMLQKINNDIQLEVTRETRPGATFRDVLRKAKTVVCVKLEKNMEGAVVGVLLGALLGTGVMVKIVIQNDPTTIQCVLAALSVGVGGATGMLGGALVADQPGTPTEMVQDATVFLMELERLCHQSHRTWNAFRGGPAPDPGPGQ